MGLTCLCYEPDGDGCYYYPSDDYQILDTNRAKRCCSCATLIHIGNTALKFDRAHFPNDDIQERIYGDEVYMAPWWMCENCADLYFSLTALGFCIMLGDKMLDLAKEYGETYGSSNR